MPHQVLICTDISRKRNSSWGEKVRTEMQRPQLAERASQQAKLRGRDPKAGEAEGHLNSDNDRN